MTLPVRMGYRPPDIPEIKEILLTEEEDAAAGANTIFIDVRGRVVFAIFGLDVDNACEVMFDLVPPGSGARDEKNFPLIVRGMTAATIGASWFLERPLKIPFAGDWRIGINYFGVTLNDRIRAGVLVG